MKKHSAKHPEAPEKIEVGHLDATLTEITQTTAERLKKWRKPIIVSLLAIVAIGIVYTLLGAFAENREEGLNERIYALIGSPAAHKEGYVPDKAEVASVLESVRGTKSEEYVLKSLGNFYAEQADSLVDKAKKAAADAQKPVDGTSTPPVAADPKASSQAIEEARDQALRLAGEAAQRFPSDPDMQHWATALKAKIEGERKTSWLPASWKYTLPPPRAAESSATAPPAAPAAPAVPLPGPTPAPVAAPPVPATPGPETQK